MDAVAAGGTGERRKALLAAEPGLALLVALLLAILAVRVIGLATSHAELFFDEAQYWDWAQRPAFGYFNKPPLIAWIIAATTAVFGDAPFGVRIGAPVIHFGTSLAIYALALKLFDRRAAFWASLLYAVMPGTSLSATLMSTDVPLLFFWTLALLAMACYAERPSWRAGAGLGVAVGLGLLAKYAMVYLFVCYAVYAAISPKARRSLKHPGVWLGLLLAVAIVAPNVVWNAENHFATFAHTGDNASLGVWGARFPNIVGMLGFLVTQVGIIGPVPFAAFVVAVARRAPDDAGEARRMLLASSLPVFALLTLQALINKANGNWAATGFPAAVTLAAAAMLFLKWRRGMVFTLWLSAVLLFGFSFYGSLVGVIDSGPLGRQMGKLTGWGAFAAEVEEAARQTGVGTVVVYNSRGLTASMVYELRDTGLAVRDYTRDKAHPTDEFEITRPWSPGDPGPALLVYAGTGAPPAAVAARARLVKTFDTRTVVAKRLGWKASIYEVK